MSRGVLTQKTLQFEGFRKMKKGIILAVMLLLYAGYAYGGSISGTVSYSGAQSGTIYVCASTDPTFMSECDGEATLSSPGSYTISALPDATYYIGSIMFTVGPDETLPTDPYGGYGTLDNPTAVIISGSVNVTGINITLVDGTASNPNPFAEPPAHARSQHWSNGYFANFTYNDPNHRAISVYVTGPSISSGLTLAYDTASGEWGSWVTGADGNLFFGSSHSTPPLTYTFHVTDAVGTTTIDATICCFVEEFATNLSPSGTVMGSPEFTWTRVQQTGITYQVQVSDSSGNRVWDSEESTSTYKKYTGPALTAQNTYTYWVVARDQEDNESFAAGSFVFGGYPNPGSISGIISYTGTQDGVVVAGALGDSWVGEVQISSTGAFTIPNLPDGIYHVASVMVTESGEGLLYTDPWGVYGSTVTISGGNAVSGVNISLSDSTTQSPNPWGWSDEGSVATTLQKQTITVDEATSDWSGIQPVVTDPQGDDLSLKAVFQDKQGADISAIYLAYDSNNLYMRMDLYDGPANTTFRNNGSGLGNTGRYMYNLDTDSDGQMDIEINIVYSSERAAWEVEARDSNHQHIAAIETAASVAAAGNTIELSLPLSGLSNATTIGIFPTVFFFTSDIWKSFWDKAKHIKATLVTGCLVGDIDGNGAVNILDVILNLRIALGLDSNRYCVP